jgi:DNA-binding CsgD family transcriptional regulator
MRLRGRASISRDRRCTALPVPRSINGASCTGWPRLALQPLRDAWMLWGEIPAPYEAARTRVLIAGAHRQLGDNDTATMELDVARQVFARIGASPDLARIDAPGKNSALPGGAGALTTREREVLVLVATGKTNRTIGRALTISEKTVARHVSNIFTKLSVSTRAAATAYAHRRGLA